MTKTDSVELDTQAFNNELMTVEFVNEEKFAIVYIHRAPANAFSYELLKAVTKVFKRIEEVTSIRTVIFASKIERFFSAGVDLEEFNRVEESWLEYWKALRTMFITIYESRLNTISAINGFAIGLGCALALGIGFENTAIFYVSTISLTFSRIASQDRYMLKGRGTIGINPVNIGIPVPIWIMQRYIELVGQRVSEKLLTLGVSLKATEAKDIGLVDEIFDDENEMLEACKALARAKHQIYEIAQVETTRLLRETFVKTFYSQEEEDMKRMAYFVQLPEINQIVREKQKEIQSKKATKSTPGNPVDS
ncbi:hypothetical protein K7432_007014 [Basidiobolus ranarum]|uniref:Enoyl-CoA hydratase n=1 Tax=Basidiobolus ranarum TaxID=34480 RepID=A0ABR2WU27_9FUNG